jgi:energy-coupling factor transporter ATP-binding protein EcfA2
MGHEPNQSICFQADEEMSSVSSHVHNNHRLLVGTMKSILPNFAIKWIKSRIPSWPVMLLILFIIFHTAMAFTRQPLCHSRILAASAFNRRCHQESDLASSNSTIQWCPSAIQVDDISKVYPDTLWRRLTSSVPRRQFALRNVSCAFFEDLVILQNRCSSSGAHKLHTECYSIPRSLVLLVGSSSSGKSTLLSMIQGQDLPTDGFVRRWTHWPTTSPKMPAAIVARPVLLEGGIVLDRPQSTIQSELRTVIRTIRVEHGTSETSWTLFEDALLRECSINFDLSLEQQLQSLTPSEKYRLSLAQATIKSSLSNACPPNFMDGNWLLPGPILLLDEWMDKETSQVAARVVPTLQAIVHACGGIVISASHKPNLYEQATNLTRITLSSGKILEAKTRT